MARFFQMFETVLGPLYVPCFEYTTAVAEHSQGRQRTSTLSRLSTWIYTAVELSPANKYYKDLKNKLLVGLLKIREEIKLLVEVKDIRDEINIILSVLSIQRTLIEQMSQSEPGKFAFLHTPAADNIVKAEIYDFTKSDSHTRTIQDKVG
jgi:hypothetical protein